VKIGIISDIHANLPALQATLDVLKQEQCVKILCAGDVVGYGPHPRQCIEIVRELRIPCVKGNHDFWVTEDARAWGISADARAAAEWTRTVLSAEDLAWLAALPRTIQYGSIEVVHASLAWRPQWAYVTQQKIALVHFLFQRTTCCFHGHSHVPQVTEHQHGQRPTFRPVHDGALPAGKRVLINVGAVGQPRDSDPRACCAVYQVRENSIRLLRIPYDVAAVQQDMRAAGLPDRLVERLGKGE